MRTLTCVVQYRARFCVCVCVWEHACTRTHFQNAHLSPQKCIPEISEHGCVTPHLGVRWLGALCYIFAFAGPYFLFMIEQWAWKTRSKDERETGSFHSLSLFLPPSLLPLSPTSLSLFLRSVSFGGSEAKANRSRKVSFQFFHRMCQNFGLESEMQFPGISAPRRATVSYSFKNSLNYYLNSNIYRVFNFTNNLPISSPK